MQEVDMVVKVVWAAVVSVGFAVLFNTPKRAMWAVALLGGIGFGLKTIVLKFLIPDQLVMASLIGASGIGLLGIYFAHRVHTPPIVFTIPAVINMIPGTLGYEFMIGIINIVSLKAGVEATLESLIVTLSNGLNAIFVLLVLAFGVVLPILIFNTNTVKNKDLNKFLKKKVIDVKRKYRSH
ncbi:threonine/serine exporter family protein [Riemerella columbipharyngis]|uniref:Uncharacterized membrane protein YjjB, DUF3815 family n=1 Tax=Riemerella columbipharyngis TaxID=1071918 RepID=A0A1G7EUH9_9FLAO|nr:threonine/serine exporter family protein [Riemerella columbipharyngis]SDE67166.1 Uncharacterized membrane protein YjjB, DUF3815 family [Riemerella columbipharyngis]